MPALCLGDLRESDLRCVVRALQRIGPLRMGELRLLQRMEFVNSPGSRADRLREQRRRRRGQRRQRSLVEAVRQSGAIRRQETVIAALDGGAGEQGLRLTLPTLLLGSPGAGPA